MSLIKNYWPDPRFADVGRISQINCQITDATHDFAPQSNVFPQIVIKTTNEGNCRGERLVSVPVGMKIVVSCRAGNDGDTPNVGSAITAWTPSGSAFLASVPPSGGVSGEFTVPAEGIKICFRAPENVGQSRWIGNVFVGTKTDYDALVKLVPSGFLAGDLMPQQN
ncbi:hypothetical protein [uncultured Bifidobacterium sp.]|uniref:hypothetical protein n=1 Tax=uncultured Bifidobacterium sp. TaxID=165187 RepID=UPI00262EF82E|nr:hypothetical protein [uncultured Bifidobacterium sp.]